MSRLFTELLELAIEQKHCLKPADTVLMWVSNDFSLRLIHAALH